MTEKEIIKLLENEYNITCSNNVAKYLKNITYGELGKIISPIVIEFRDNPKEDNYTAFTILDKPLKFKRKK